MKRISFQDKDFGLWFYPVSERIFLSRLLRSWNKTDCAKGMPLAMGLEDFSLDEDFKKPIDNVMEHDDIHCP